MINHKMYFLLLFNTDLGAIAMAANTMAIENSFRMNQMAGVALTAGPEAALRQRYDQPLRMN